jgi:DNA-directed RNA polymerase specialized sigma24 family protein
VKRTDREPVQNITNPDLALLVFTSCTEWVQDLHHEHGAEVCAVGAGWLIGQLEATTTALANERASAVRTLRANDWSLAEIAHALGMSRARVEQIANR